MVLERFRRREADSEKEAEDTRPDWVELQNQDFKEELNINVKVDTLQGFADTSRIQNLLREGNIVFLKIKGLRQNDISELKRSVEKLKKTATAMDGDIVGVDTDYLVLTPKHAQIHRGG